MVSTASKLAALLMLALRSGLFLDQPAAEEAYSDVRNAQYTWAILEYEGKQLGEPITGSDYYEMLTYLQDDNRVYAYARFETGDGAKFAFITWIGPSVSSLKKAKVSTDKAFVKNIWPQFGKEILAEQKSEVQYNVILRQLE